MEEYDRIKIETDILNELKTIYDPDLPVNIYELGLIYNIDIQDNYHVQIKMTLTSPNCPMAPQIIKEVNDKVKSVKNIKGVDVKLVWDPPWEISRMSEVARLDLGYM